jgi:hypothetical protein
VAAFSIGSFKCQARLPHGKKKIKISNGSHSKIKKEKKKEEEKKK